MKIPPAISRLPQDEYGNPIPWIQCRPNQGPSHFLRTKLCWICGRKLTNRFAYMGDLHSPFARTFNRPPGCPQCVKWQLLTHNQEGVHCLWINKSKVPPQPFDDGTTREDGASKFLVVAPPARWVQWFRDGEPLSPDELIDLLTSHINEQLRLSAADPDMQAELRAEFQRQVDHYLPLTQAYQETR